MASTPRSSKKSFRTRRRPLDEVPVLDFDVYLQLRDSKEVARVLLPKIEEFMLTRARENACMLGEW